MSPLYIKLGPIKQFVKALDKDGAAFKYLQNLFPKLSESKVRGGIFIGPQVKLILKSDEYLETLSAVAKNAWMCLAAVVQGFLGNNKEDNYAELVANLVNSYGNMGCRMSIKVHMLDAHLNEFKENLGAYSEEHSEQFHQDIKDFESRYQGQYNKNMMGDYIWGLIRESDLEYRRKSRKTTHF